jgi:hypothetical protein
MQRSTKTNSTRLYSIILPLSLVCRLVGELDHPDPGAKLKKLDPPKGLGEQIRNLVLGIDVARLEVPFLQAASDEVVPHPDVLAPFMKNRILCQGQSGLAVHPEFHRYSVSVEEITKQSNKPERLSRSGGGCYILILAAGQGHHLLLDRLSANETLDRTAMYSRKQPFLKGKKETKLVPVCYLLTCSKKKWHHIGL